jgi:hypothetical protein
MRARNGAGLCIGDGGARWRRKRSRRMWLIGIVVRCFAGVGIGTRWRGSERRGVTHGGCFPEPGTAIPFILGQSSAASYGEG